jgi:hypothetical protein
MIKCSKLASYRDAACEKLDRGDGLFEVLGRIGPLDDFGKFSQKPLNQ